MLGSVTFVIIPDAFQVEVNRKVVVDHVPGRSVAEYLDELVTIDRATLTGAINGVVATDILSAIPEPGDIVSVTAQYEAGAIAAWVATLITGTSVAAGASIFSAGLGYALAYGVGYIAASYLITVGMGMLVSALGGRKADGSPSDSSSTSPTYSFGQLRQTDIEGLPIPLVFGTVRMAGQVISKYTTVEADGKEYLHYEMVVNDGLVDLIDDIRINNQAASHFAGVTTYTRLGALDQDEIPGFDRVVQQHAESVLLRCGAATVRQTDGDAVEQINLSLTCPYGLYYSNNSGGLDSRSVDVRIEYRSVGGAWQELKVERITGATNSAIRSQVVIDGLAPARYEVRLTRLTGDSSSFREQTDTSFVGFSEVVKRTQVHPGLARYAVSSMASDQLSSEPSFSCRVVKSTVSVFNPYTGLWMTASASNPAWATYGLMVNHHKIPASQMIYDEFRDWAVYCDELVDGQPRFRLGIVLDTASDLWSNVQKVAAVGRGRIMRRGAFRYGVFSDRPVSVVSHLFTMATIKADSYSRKYLPKRDRSNACEITYWDPDRDFTSQIAPYRSAAWRTDASTDKSTKTQIAAYIPRAQALREACYAVVSNERILETVVFEAAWNSFTCRVGDVAYFQHVTPNYEGAFGGRIIEVTTITTTDGETTSITLDRPVTLLPGVTYAVLVQRSDDSLVERVLKPVSEQTCTDIVTVAEGYAVDPHPDDQWMLGPAATYKRAYWVIQTKRTNRLSATITLLQYDESIFGEADAYQGDATGGYSLPVTQQAVHAQARERLVWGAGGDYQSAIDVTWVGSADVDGSNWSVFIADITESYGIQQTDGPAFVGADGAAFASSGIPATTMHLADTSDTKFTVPASILTVGHRYRITIAPYNSGASDTGSNTVAIEIKGKLAPPEDVMTMVAAWDSVRRVVIFTWSQVADIDAAGYEIRRGDWELGTVLRRVGLGGSWEWPVPPGTISEMSFSIKAIDTSGIYSEHAAEASCSIDTTETTIEVPTGLAVSSEASIDADGTARVFLYANWDANAELSDIFGYYAIRITDTISGRVTSMVSQASEWHGEVLAAREYGVEVQAVDVTGNRTAWCEAVSVISAKDSVAPEAPEWESPGLVPGFRVMALRWKGGSETDISHYEVERSLMGEFDGEEVFLGFKSGTFTTDSNLEVSTRYYYRFRAIDTSGNASGWSSVEYATTLAIGTSDIAYRSIIASHLDVEALSAISANLGTVTAGEMQSPNWGPAAGMLIDLVNAVLKLGGSASPAFEWDGSQVTIRNAAEGETLELSGTRVSIGRLDGDYCAVSGGDISFYRLINGNQYLAKSLKRIDSGTGIINNSVVTLDGVWRTPPKIIVSPCQLSSYNSSHPNQTQTLQVHAADIKQVGDSCVYQFTPVATLGISAGTSNNAVSQNRNLAFSIFSDFYAVPSAYSYGTANIPIVTTTNVNMITVTGSWHVFAATGVWSHGGKGGVIIGTYCGCRAYLYAVVDGISHLLDSIEFDWLSTNNQYDSGVRSVTATYTLSVGEAHTVALYLDVQRISGGYIGVPTASVSFDSYSVNYVEGTELASGTLNYMAIGE